MKFAHVGTRYILTNADRSKYFSFAGKEPRRYSNTVEDLVQAQKFSSAEEAQKVIDINCWGAIAKDQLTFVVPVLVSVMIEIPGSVPQPEAGADFIEQEDLDICLSVTQIALDDEDTREHIAEVMDLSDEEIERLRTKLALKLDPVVLEEPVDQDAV